MDLRIIAYDPGLTTGLCIIENQTPGGEYEFFQQELTFRQVGDLLRVWEDEGVLKTPCTFVCESFTINQQTARNSQAPWSLEVIGLIRYAAMRNHIELVMQQPSAAKNLVRDDVIKAAGKWVKGKPHAMDATRHAIYHAIIDRKQFREWVTPVVVNSED